MAHPYMTDIVPKDRIGREAREAARKGLSLDDACPYPWGTPAADHFKAVYYAAPIIAAWERRIDLSARCSEGAADR